MKKIFYFLILTLLFIIAINYGEIDSYIIKKLEPCEYGKVERIVDGDTLIINGTSVRLLGINTPEKGEKYYQEAKLFLEEKILDKEVKLCFSGQKTDKYGRILAYIFYQNKNINLESVREGYANFYFPSGKKEYYSNFKEAWEECLINEKNLCEKSKNQCIVFQDLTIELQILKLKNTCPESQDLTGWSIKDEGRKKYVLPKTILRPEEEIIITKKDFGEDYVWTKTGDSVFVRDETGKLVLFYNF